VHVTHILAKLEFHSRAQIAAWAVERGLLSRSASNWQHSIERHRRAACAAFAICGRSDAVRFRHRLVGASPPRTRGAMRGKRGGNDQDMRLARTRLT
jgi:hypothetical protein